METTNVPQHNVLLLGESGAGKSTFINAFKYYALYDKLEQAKNSYCPCLISYQFVFTDERNLKHVVKEIGSWDDNETLGGVQSATRECQSFPFHFRDYQLRLIDTAGVGGSNTMEVDDNNIEAALAYVERFRTLNAIAIVIKSDQVRCTTTFKYCMKQLLTSLDRGAASNVLFIFTYSETSEYKPGPAREALESILVEMDDGKSVLGSVINPEAIFCFENKWLRYGAAAKRGLAYSAVAVSAFHNAWVESKKEFQRFLDYVIGLNDQPGLQPHAVKNMMSISDAKKYIKIIYPMFDGILLNVAKNTANLDEQARNVESGRANSLKPIKTIEYKALTQANTICTSEKCRVQVFIDGVRFYEYPRICCAGCAISYHTFRRLFCVQMELLSGQCKICRCHSSEHHRVFYKKEEVVKEIASAADMGEADLDLSRNQFNVRVTKTLELLQRLEDKRRQLEDEANIVQNAMLVFAKFLQSNAIASPSSDELEAYRKMEDKVKKGTNKEKNSRSAMDKRISLAAESVVELWDIKPADIQQMISQLHAMKIYGPQIQNAYNIQQNAYVVERERDEIQISIPKFLKIVMKAVKGGLVASVDAPLLNPD